MKKFINLSDLHFGYQRKNGHKVALHDPKALDVALQFASEFKPDVIILSGDELDCGAISHHNKNKPGRTEGLRILSDADECVKEFINPLNALGAAQKVYIEGNHEMWLRDVEEELPGAEGLLSITRLLHIEDWEFIPQGEHFNLGKLTFIHGDQLSGGEHVAKAAVIAYERSVRFGHFHTHQTYTKNSPIDHQLGKVGMAVPCLCKKDPNYGKGKPNRWVQGVNFGYVFPDGTYADGVSLITNGRMVAEGKVYRG